MEQLSKRQKEALAMALLMKTTANTDPRFERRLKQILLRGYVIYKRRDRLETNTLYNYQCNLKRRLKECMEFHSDNTELPYYSFLLLKDQFLVPTDIDYDLTVGASQVNQKYFALDNQHKFSLFRYHIAWVRLCLAVCTTNPLIVRLKKKLGCISLIPIKVRKEPVKVRNVRIHYHDLYHLEVAQLERIQMGRYMVSGIHGIKAPVFHDFPILQEYDGFLDEARIAIHEWLTRPTAFSKIKAICWMTLLILHGINPFAVVMRHLKSMKKKQQELWC
ncbi:hypothetical protein NDI37_08070 [Funiculus sociatus GB2-A5]|uniref:Uncharacterized protein n=1 Tax=Funiculus sociatus GB2-A5 TaxID=2933946 RepID=A0ABV0JLV3_9CYAN|nr:MULTISPECIES: hypothetical protein [unclassified Trichocoleus]MBD1907192.1 hypothetical protein [Trichocoleus sp. FACHB-832]MBD2064235.1 hypothetical protein [Trichocoleus sp. FACHB-6]